MVIDDFNGDNFDHSDVDFIHGGYLSLTQTGNRPIQTNPIPAGTPTWGKEFKENSLRYINQTLSIGAMVAIMPNKQHYLDLDPMYKDTFGDPLIRMTYDFRDQDRELAKFTSTKAKEIMEEMGADHIDAMEELGPYDIRTYQSTHNTGGVIMGADPDTSAVNNYLKMWEDRKNTRLNYSHVAISYDVYCF